MFRHTCLRPYRFILLNLEHQEMFDVSLTYDMFFLLNDVVLAKQILFLLIRFIPPVNTGKQHTPYFGVFIAMCILTYHHKCKHTVEC